VRYPPAPPPPLKSPPAPPPPATTRYSTNPVPVTELTLKVPDDVKIWALYTAPGGDV
jgi:hypothetical protein